MKNKIAIASAFIAASSFSSAEIVVNDFLSFEGFVDMSYTHVDLDANDSSDNTFGLDQVEISWLFDFDPITAQIDLQYLGDNQAENGTSVEQAFVTYHVDTGGAFTAGLYASMLGFEAFEPTGLYQFSLAYDGSAGTLLPDYAQGVKYTHETESTFFGVSIQDTAVEGSYRGRLGGNDNGSLVTDDGGFGIEVAGSVSLETGYSFFLGGAIEDGDDGDSYVVNTYATYETGAWIFAAELNYGESDSGVLGTDGTVFSGLLMANFAYSDVASITGRLSYVDVDSDTIGDNWLKYTLAHGYAFTDNLFFVTEVSYSDLDNASTSALSAAAELIFSF